MEPARVLWDAVDTYTAARLHKPDPALDNATRNADAASLPAIAVSPALGKFLHLIARARHAQSILEIGTLAGYSTIWLARALPTHGRLITLELDPAHAAVARTNLTNAGLIDRVDIRIGPALASLESMPTPTNSGGVGGNDGFDLVFIDADKASTPAYFAHALRLANPRAVIIVDNVVRWGRILSADSDDPDIQGVRTMLRDMGAEPRIDATVLQTVGIKGYDGLAIAIVND